MKAAAAPAWGQRQGQPEQDECALSWALTSTISVFELLIACHFCTTMSATEDDGGARNVCLLAVPDPPDRSR